MKGVELDDSQEVVQLRRICISLSTPSPGCQAISTEYDVLGDWLMECTGFIDAKADGTFNSDGYCNHWDKDAHHWVGHWWHNSKMEVARFEVVSGTGKYTGATGGGTSNCKWLQPPPDPQAACEIRATIKLQ